MDDRGVSEVVGVILLTAVVVILVTIVSAAMLTQHAPGTSPPQASFDATVNTTVVAIHHTGGESVPLDETSVVIRAPNETNRTSMESAGRVIGGGRSATQFDPGDRWRWTHGLNVSTGDRVEVLVVHEPSNSVLYDGNRIVMR